jgi:peptidoglycan/LPS O-acetylase OafA/YrhL
MKRLMSRIEELDGLRAVAIVGVFLTHFTPTYHHFSDFLRLGWTGVDLFFAISGFLITNILLSLRGQESALKNFYWRRTLRIFPPYYLVLTLIIVLSFFHSEHGLYGASIRCWLFLSSVKLGLIKLAVSKFLLHSNPVLPTPHPVAQYYFLKFKDCLGVYWSLSVEEIFYLVWAPLILMGRPRMILLGSVVPLLLCPALRGLVHTPDASEVVGFVFRFDSLAAGGCVALLLRAVEKGYLNQRFLDRVLILVIILSSLSLILLSGYCGLFRGLDVRAALAFSIVGFSLLAILCASIVGACVRWTGSLGVVSRVLRSKFAIYLGTISYMMYLIHMPAYIAIQLLMLRNLGKASWEIADTNVLLLCGILAVSCTVVLAGLSWKYFETPILRIKDRRFPSPAPSTISVIGVARL